MSTPKSVLKNQAYYTLNALTVRRTACQFSSKIQLTARKEFNSWCSHCWFEKTKNKNKKEQQKQVEIFPNNSRKGNDIPQQQHLGIKKLSEDINSQTSYCSYRRWTFTLTN